MAGRLNDKGRETCIPLSSGVFDDIVLCIIFACLTTLRILLREWTTAHLNLIGKLFVGFSKAASDGDVPAD